MIDLNLKTIQTQCVIFFEKTKNIDFEDLSYNIKQKINIDFISPSNYTNIPDFAPAEIPRLEMTSVDKLLTIAASNSNIVLTHKEMSDTSKISQIAANNVRVLAEIICKKATIVRFGYVVIQTIDNEKPADFIASKILGRKIQNAFEYTCKIVLKAEYSGMKYNNSFFFEPGERFENNSSTPLVIVTRDINLPPKQGGNLTPIFLENFLNGTSDELRPERLSTVFIQD